MKIQLLFLVAALVVSYVSAQEPWVCKNGVHYVTNNCNVCNCVNGGLGCTRNLCFPRSPELENCAEHGKVTQKDCNTCVCTKVYGTVCTNDKCENSS